MDVNLKEVQRFSEVSMVMGSLVFIVACVWDNVIGVTANHHEGLGYMQVLVIAASGLYTLWSYTIHLKWKEYLKQIHNLGDIE